MKFSKAMWIVENGGKVRLPAWDYDEFVYCVRVGMHSWQIQTNIGEEKSFRQYTPTNNDMRSIHWQEVYDENNLPSKFCECSGYQVREHGHKCRNGYW